MLLRPRTPHSPSPYESGARPTRLRAALLVAAALASVVPLGVSAGPAASATRTAGEALRCSQRTAPNGQFTLSPAVTPVPSRVSARGTVDLDGCSSPDGLEPQIRSGRLEVRGSATASCTQVAQLTGRGTITWYAGPHGTGRMLGQSAVQPASQGQGGYSPLDAFLSGRIVSGLMSGHRVSGTAVPTNDVRACFNRGLSEVEARGHLTVQ